MLALILLPETRLLTCHWARVTQRQELYELGQLAKNKQLDTRPYGGCSLGLSFAEVGSLGST
jgi:hypothetical protein